jgi:hypothetical protein
MPSGPARRAAVPPSSGSRVRGTSTGGVADGPWMAEGGGLAGGESEGAAGAVGCTWMAPGMAGLRRTP